MTQPLNYCTKAIEALAAFDATAQGASRVGLRYIANKLRQAQVFVMPDHGELLDRSKPRTDLPGITLQPPFPVVALEYSSPGHTAGRGSSPFDAPCSKRIALAWRWANDLPPALASWSADGIEDGIVVASIAFSDESKLWLPVAAAAHMAFDDSWEAREASPPIEAMVAAGQLTRAQADAKAFPMTLIPLLPEALVGMAQMVGQEQSAHTLAVDLMDEVNAYVDLCHALACRNVSVERQEQPAALNRARLRAGKLPFSDFHVLKLASGNGGRGAIGASHGSPRSHLRRGHIRRLRHLAPDRVTWVNAAMVRGHGFVDKVYAL